jgi:hypothetical protein
MASVAAQGAVAQSARTVGLGFLIGVGVLFAWLSRSAGDSGRPVRVAVLPFENLPGFERRVFADGTTDAVRGKPRRCPDSR